MRRLLVSSLALLTFAACGASRGDLSVAVNDAEMAELALTSAVGSACTEPVELCAANGGQESVDLSTVSVRSAFVGSHHTVVVPDGAFSAQVEPAALPTRVVPGSPTTCFEVRVCTDSALWGATDEAVRVHLQVEGAFAESDVSLSEVGLGVTFVDVALSRD